MPTRRLGDGVDGTMEERPPVQDKSPIIAREEKTMKETYESPVIEIIEIDADDIIFASGICTEANR